MAISTILDHENVIKCYGYYHTATPPRNINNGVPTCCRHYGGRYVVGRDIQDLLQFQQSNAFFPDNSYPHVLEDISLNHNQPFPSHIA